MSAHINELPRNNGEIGENLHDFNPKHDFNRRVNIRMGIWACIYLVTFLFAAIVGSFTPLLKTILLLLLGAQGVDFVLLLFLLLTGKIPTHWDEMDYTPFVKRDFGFTAKDGSRHFAYIYIPQGIDVKNLDHPLPAIIGLHGWGAHHHEMDRYCLPSAQKLNCLYFTFDAFGQGQTPGDVNDLRQFDHVKEFIDLVYKQPFVDKNHLCVVAMSMGAAKASVVAYPNPKIRALVLLSGPYNLSLTKQTMTNFERFMFRLNGLQLNNSVENLKAFSGMNFFTPEGIILEGHTKPTPNRERVFLMANADDPAVKVDNTLKAAENLQLPPSNYRIFPKGKHAFQTDEFYVSVEIYCFLKQILDS